MYTDLATAIACGRCKKNIQFRLGLVENGVKHVSLWLQVACV